MKRSLLSLLLCLFSASAHAQSSCPQNSIQCNTHEFTSYAPTYSLYCPPEFQQTGSSTISYDLTTGAFASSSSGRDFGSGAAFTIFDIYQLVGSTPHCGFSFQVHLHLMGKFTRVRTLGADGTLDARLLDTFSLNEAHFYLDSHASTTVDTVLTIPLSQCRDPFTLQFELGTSAGWGDYTASAQVIFDGLPPGVAATSCQGFHVEGPIATLPVTWGSLRARYR